MKLNNKLLNKAHKNTIKFANKNTIKLILIKLNNILDKYCLSNNYKKEIKKSIEELLYFLYENNKNIYFGKISNKNIQLFCNLKFDNISTKYKKSCIIKKYLSKVYKNKFYYKKKLITHVKNKKTFSSFLFSNECKKLIRFFKAKNDFEGLLCFFFLFLEGLTIYELSIINKNNIKKNNLFIKYSKGKRKTTRKLPTIISLLLSKLIQKNEDSNNKFLFFKNIKNYYKKKRAQRIRILLLKQYSKIINNKICIDNLFKYFSSNRKALKFTYYCQKLFDLDVDICEGLEDENTINSFVENIENDDNDS